MKYFILTSIISITVLFAAYSQTAKEVGDCTISYTIDISSGTGKATKTLYIKGMKTRSEITSTAFNQTTIYDNKTGEAVILKESGDEKYMTKLDATAWKKKNSKWEGSTLKLENDTKDIAGYSCRKAVITTKVGKQFVLYYAPSIIPSATENPYQFKNILGLVLEYETQTAEGKDITISAVKVDMSPVPAARFELPSSGYRVI